MPKERNVLNALIVSSTAVGFEKIKSLLPRIRFGSVLHAASANEARLKASDGFCDIVIISTPLRDESGIQLAVDISGRGRAEVLVLAGQDIYSQASYITERYGIILLATPCSRQVLTQTVTVLATERIKLARLFDQNQKLREKLDELKLCDRAKLMLMQNLGMTEEQAHKYIEKTAMDRCVKRTDVASDIIKTYES